MTNPLFSADAGDAERHPWLARIHADADGRVLGAGIILDERRVLTCAHVLPAGSHPGSFGARSWATLRVDAVGQSPRQQRRARVSDDGWIPRRSGGDHTEVGDLAVLELEKPLDPGTGAPLHRLSTAWGTPLRAFGFPHTRTSGIWAGVVVQGGSGELVQIDALPGRVQIDRGFSGAGVVDGQNRVVGMVMSKLITEGPSVAWMMPVETITRYLPSLIRQETDALADAGRISAELTIPGNRMVIVIADDDGRRAQVIALLSSLLLAAGSRPEQTGDSRTAASTAPLSTVVTVDATGLSTPAVVTLIADGLQLDATDPDELIKQLERAGNPVTVVVDGADAAATPDTLMDDVILPIAGLDSGSGRVVVGVRRDPGITSRSSQSVRLTDADPPGTFTERLDRLDPLISDLRDAEARAAAVPVMFTEPPGHPPQADKLRIRLAMLSRARPGPDVFARLAATERSAARALQRARQTVANDNERRELQGRLDAYQVRAAAAGYAEDAALDGRFDLATGALHRIPCDLAGCRTAVLAYQAAVWRRLGLDPPAEGQ